MEKQIKAYARVQITVEVEASMWGGECQIAQLYKQAAESGVEKIRNVLLNALLKDGTRCAIIGEPKVIGVITEA